MNIELVTTESLYDKAVEAVGGSYEDRLRVYEERLRVAEGELEKELNTRAKMTSSKDDRSLDRQRKNVRNLKAAVAYLQKKVDAKHKSPTTESFKPMSLTSPFETTAKVVS